MRFLASWAQRFFRLFGYEVVAGSHAWNGHVIDPHFERGLLDQDRAILTLVKPYTMTSCQRILAVSDAIRYLVRNHIAGDIVECGVWRGGSMMAAAFALLQEKDTTRQLFLFDTFEGMTEPTSRDRDFSGRAASEYFEQAKDRKGHWLKCSVDDVTANIALTHYPRERVTMIKGKVEETIPTPAVGKIALLRLDTDWYESTRHELVHLFPLLVEGGVLIVDDYGDWQGSKEAVDEYFGEHKEFAPLLHRIDGAGRMCVKRRA